MEISGSQHRGAEIHHGPDGLRLRHRAKARGRGRLAIAGRPLGDVLLHALSRPRRQPRDGQAICVRCACAVRPHAGAHMTKRSWTEAETALLENELMAGASYVVVAK